jgi:sialic acid synthase SpsE
MSVEIVAEMSASHNGSLAVALEICEQAKARGADAIKLQTMQAETMCADGADEHCVIPSGPWKGRRMIDLYRECAMPREWHEPIIARCASLGLPWFSTPFAPEDVDFLEGLGCPRYKVASFEITDLALIGRIAQTYKPVIYSVGVASWDDLHCAIRALPSEYDHDVTLLHCVSEYPAMHMGMGRMNDLYLRDGTKLGLSDHSMTPTASVMAVALGAVMVEKHLCLRRADGGPDSGFALEPAEFREHVRLIREAEQAMRAPEDKDNPNRRFRKGLWLIKDVRAGEALSAENCRALRPCVGLEPAELPGLLGRRFLGHYRAQQPLDVAMLYGED